MAIDNNSLCYLFDSIFQIENIAGRPVVGGHIEVFIAGTDQKYITWQNFDGTKNPFKIPLNNDGRAVILVEPHYTYDIYIYDSFNNMICSRLNVKPAIGGDVTVYGLTEVWHDGTMSGEGTPQSPLSVVSAGKVYDGIEPIVVNNIENKISAQHIPLGVQDPLYFVEDSETACIIGLSGGTVPEGTMNESAFGYEDGQITSYNGSAFSAGNTYEEGDNINITNSVISGKYWTDEIISAANDASAAATAWTDSQGYITGVDLSEYAKESFVISAIDSSTSGLLPTSAFATASGSFITALPADLATTGFVADVSADITAMIPTALTGDYLTKESADTLYQPTGNYQSALDFGYVGSEISSINGSGIYSQGGTANPQIPVTGINGIKISESGDKVVFEVSGDYYTNDNPSGFITGVPADMATTGDIADLAQSISENYQPIGDYQTAGNYQTAGDYYSASNPSGFITGVDLTPYQTTAEMTAYLTTGDSANFYTTANESGFITGVDLTPYQTVEGMTAYQPVGSYLTANALDSVSGNWNEVSAKLDTTAFSDVSGTFLTAHQDISNKLDTTAFSDVSGNFLTAVPDTYLQNTDLTIVDDKITEISGIPLSAGDELPEGLMNESAVEYNAVNEISGYNGSAIAQYGAEKQWLQHDDTIVHISNSAQYAFGCNISALQRLMGIDETVLFETTGNRAVNSGTFSEPLSSFKYIDLYANRSNQDNNPNLAAYARICTINGVPGVQFFQAGLIAGNTLFCPIAYCNLTNTTFNFISARNVEAATTATSFNIPTTAFANMGLQKAVGIGRKS